MLGFDAIGRQAIGQIPRSSSITLPIQSASYVVTGKTLVYSLTFATTKATYTVTPNALTFSSGAPVIQKMTFAVTTNPVLTHLDYRISPAAYVVTGVDVTFSRDFEAWFPRPFQSASWSSESNVTNTWTPATVQPEVWTPE